MYFSLDPVWESIIRYIVYISRFIMAQHIQLTAPNNVTYEQPTGKSISVIQIASYRSQP